MEDQQAEALSSTKQHWPRQSAEEKSKQRERQGLSLSRARIAQQLASATNSTHRQMLEQALADLDQKLARLG